MHTPNTSSRLWTRYDSTVQRNGRRCRRVIWYIRLIGLLCIHQPFWAVSYRAVFSLPFSASMMAWPPAYSLPLLQVLSQMSPLSSCTQPPLNPSPAVAVAFSNQHPSRPFIAFHPHVPKDTPLPLTASKVTSQLCFLLWVSDQVCPIVLPVTLLLPSGGSWMETSATMLLLFLKQKKKSKIQ